MVDTELFFVQEEDLHSSFHEETCSCAKSRVQFVEPVSTHGGSVARMPMGHQRLW